ncbi:hypothetical protein Prede_1218 [Prevotella dentalis DSM 3688]|uniref:Uncharacterized protein n=1 Tax=Prevotella dentalis (strain ATCC 49559 / DSM 3688 / JCM 13448 / NCTC 12043 / ES 2772) TaxID=908937 RepID=L0JAH7_PREDD|nr:hypothetical protein Prede_1218 [Prevotella dentalis DSM 3688]
MLSAAFLAYFFNNQPFLSFYFSTFRLFTNFATDLTTS